MPVAGKAVHVSLENFRVSMVRFRRKSGRMKIRESGVGAKML